jgi:prefoldin beta subunit
MSVDDKINKLSLFEQNLQHVINQKKNFQDQLFEVNSALDELGSVSYKIIGNFMFKKSSDDIKSELVEKKNLLNIRIKSFEKQEKEVESKFKELQEEVIIALSEKNKKVNEDG